MSGDHNMYCSANNPDGQRDRLDEWHPCPTMADVAKAHEAGHEIEASNGGEWHTWTGNTWSDTWKYKARAPQPKKIKLLGWWNTQTCELYALPENAIEQSSLWVRYPKLDDEVEK